MTVLTNHSSNSRLFQGLLTRETAIGEPATVAQYYNSVANLVDVNKNLTKRRKYNLKRRYKACYYGYKSVINRSKRADSRFVAQTNGNSKYFRTNNLIPTSNMIPGTELNTSPLGVRTNIANAALQAQLQQRTAPLKPVPPSTDTGIKTSTQINPIYLKRSDYRIGATVMIRHTADLVACGARQLVGKTGRIVTTPQVYGQELYSVYIDEHEALFHVPFNSLVLVGAARESPPAVPVTSTAIGTAPPYTQPTSTSNAKSSLEETKLEHSLQLHRLMQQQYREIQVLQQQYAENRVINPTALPAIQKELSKLRLVHLAQVQTLKSKQALDLLGKQ